MSKRSIEVNEEQDRVVSAKTESHSVPAIPASEEQDAPMNDLEEQLSDEFDSDGEIIEIDGDDEINDEDDLRKKQEEAETLVQKDQSEGNKEKIQELYLPHMSRPLGPDEVLEADPTVYEMLHNVNMPWPCLTLDVIPDTLGSERRNYPQSILLTTATQSSRKKENELMVLALSNLAKTLLKDDNEGEDDEEDDEDDVDPVIENENIPLRDTTNRLKVSPFAISNQEVLTATMSENGDVYIYNLAPQSKAFSTPGYQIPKSAKRPIHTVKNHGNVEGYGLDWSPLIKTGALLSGDCSGQIYFTQRHTSRWVTDKQPFTVSNNKSIEDIQWSRTESTVFATAGCDGYIRIWDTRSKKHKPAISVKASNTDVNVISWSDKIGYLLASGDDNGTWGVWDLRQFTPSNADAVQPLAQYDFHKGAITSIAFNPLDESIVAVGSEDNTVTLWDLSVEADDEEIKQQAAETKELQEIPPQLLFVHWQKEVKDVKWHKQIPGCLVSTGTDGLNVWKTISV
ncbi:BAD_HP_G0043950.mRNA.1.CDS.1 [Saccharomyces cerevisiae]|nr:BAD_HP_G0003530.mRNA.1.CDS.1 [Saccharomyces cerevisiae]CAI4965069.1 BAD_HP_G0001630.mRNA.1.CDS.1 [Saccharomyces cerevisiae]CAI4971340.1 BAD_HP_G0043950.mRNA.1.CDS.1 [Saccharomyces cerevisiae]CAI6403641.1 BAD_HP_G0003530.mRNA.1.CDS.1 [Saccharomyces cerevisiae]CAI6711862.1 BAD_HP_G0001630.mRNA.1.CDS.1 [Saccharomyces cerevisiae]